MPKFDKRFVYFMWDDELEGKTVFFADYIPNLQQKVENNYIEHYTKVIQSDELLPFRMEDGRATWQFVYFDPNYKLKLAYEQGKRIECKRKGDAWEDWEYTPAPGWLDDHEYRIMQERENPVTNRELSKWLAQGNGECKQSDSDMGVSTYHYYWSGEDNTPAEALVRKWGDPDWHEPTRAYLGLEE